MILNLGFIQQVMNQAGINTTLENEYTEKKLHSNTEKKQRVGRDGLIRGQMIDYYEGRKQNNEIDYTRGSKMDILKKTITKLKWE